MGNPVLGIDVTARLDAFREELKSIPDIGAKEARALTTQLSREIKKAEKTAKKSGDAVQKSNIKTAATWEAVADAVKGATIVASAFGVAAVGAVALAAKGMKALLSETLELSEEWNALGKEARGVGLAVEEFQRIEGALALLTKNGVDAERAIQDFQKRTGEAVPDLAAMADEMAAMESPAQRTTLALTLFGERAGRGMAQALAQGGDAVREAIAQIEAHGLVTAQTVVESERLQDAITLATQEWDSFVRAGLGPVVPSLTAILVVWRELMKEFRVGSEDDIRGAGEALGDGLVRAAINASVEIKSFALDVQLAFEPIGATIEGVILGFQAVEAAIAGNMAAASNLYEMAKSKGGEAVDATLALADGWRANRAEVQAFRYELTMAAREAKAIAEAPAGPGPGGAGADTPGAAGGGAGAGAVKSQLAEALDAEREAAAERITLKDETAAYIDEVDQAKHDAAMWRIQEQANAQREATEMVVGAYASMASSIGGLVADIATAVANSAEEGSEAQLKALRTAWAAESAVAVLQAGVNIPLSMSNAFANAPNPIVGGIMMAAAAVASGAAFAAVVAKASQGPPFHMGGAITTRGLAPDEVPITAMEGETMVSAADTRAAGGSRGVMDAVRGGGDVRVAFQIGPRVVDEQTHAALRTGQGTTYNAFRTVRPRRVGRHDPYSVR